MAALSKLTQDAPRHQSLVLLGGLFIHLGAEVRWREKKNFAELGIKQSYRKDNINDQKSVNSSLSILLPIAKILQRTVAGLSEMLQ